LKLAKHEFLRQESIPAHCEAATKGSARVQEDFDTGVFWKVDLMVAGGRGKRWDFGQATDHGDCQHRGIASLNWHWYSFSLNTNGRIKATQNLGPCPPLAIETWSVDSLKAKFDRKSERIQNPRVI
jgi:hypothetical protein